MPFRKQSTMYPKKYIVSFIITVNKWIMFRNIAGQKLKRKVKRKVLNIRRDQETVGQFLNYLLLSVMALVNQDSIERRIKN